MPFRHTPREVTVGALRFRGDALELAAVYPDPARPERYLAFITPGFPTSAISRLWIEPDYVVTDGERTIARGFFDERWEVDEERVYR